MMMMQRILAPGILRRAAVMRALVGVAAVPEPLAVLSCCSLQLSPVRQRWLCTSTCSRAAQEPKPTPQSAPTPAPQDVQKREAEPTPVDVDPLQDNTIGLFQRFKKTFKQYGKVMIPVHLLTSSFWLGTFYYAAMKGVNVVPFLEMIGLPESLVGLLRDSSSGYALTAYAMYKIATPARYAVTLGGTSLSVQYLRKHGYLSTPPPYSEYLQDKMEETREKLSEKMEETKERLSEKMEETKDKLSEKIQETKDRVTEGKAFFRKKGD
ncbi:protein FAM210A [Oryzias latipes]|uniref:Family with sequence similarity 210 member Ab n=1 Tax=Oryzias latipes TaxID=8090 RepID=H2LDX3_ORYLA|nr:protein FAM210A [Oryzias latipes]